MGRRMQGKASQSTWPSGPPTILQPQPWVDPGRSGESYRRRSRPLHQLGRQERERRLPDRKVEDPWGEWDARATRVEWHYVHFLAIEMGGGVAEVGSRLDPRRSTCGTGAPRRSFTLARKRICRPLPAC